MSRSFSIIDFVSRLFFGSFEGFVSLHHHIKLGIEISLIFAEFG